MLASFSRFRRRLDPTPSPSASPSSGSLSISSITLKDIKRAKQCGGGGYGAIFLLTHQKEKLALKRLNLAAGPSDIERQFRLTLREADTWREFDHPNILPFLGVLRGPDEIYLVSPYVENGCLTDYVHRHPNVDRCRLLAETAAAIAYMHKLGIIHGDIKGSNVPVSDDIHALLTDFGLSRSAETSTTTALKGQGTVRWESPELLEQGEGKTFESDAWAFGMTVYEILSGQTPFYACKISSAVIKAVVVDNQRPPMDPTHSPTGKPYAQIWKIARDCWHRDPSRCPHMDAAYNRLIGHHVFRGHSHHIHCVAFSPDGKTIVSGSGDETIRLWDMEAEGQRGDPLRGHTQTVSCISFLPDGRTIASASPDFSVRVWDVNTRAERGAALGSLDHRVQCLALSPDGRTVASGSVDDVVRVWAAENGAHNIKMLAGHMEATRCLAFSFDDKTLASGSDDRSVRVRDVDTGVENPHALTFYLQSARCLASSPDGKVIASGADDSTIQLWDTLTGAKRNGSFTGHTGAVTCLMFAPDGKTIATGSSDTTIRLWRAETGTQIGEAFSGHTGSVRCLAFSPNGKMVASGSEDRTVRIWDLDRE